jgi:pimeloyl-ACP methyl ester carboxylesterase
MSTPLRGRLLIAALLIACLQAGCASSLVYFPDPEVRRIPEQVGLSPEWAFFQAEDGVRLSAWYLPRADARGTVLFLHGNGGNVSHYVPSLALFHRLGFSSLILDYRGYGRSEGTPSEHGTYRDARAAWRHLVEAHRIPPAAIVIWGRSLGGAIAAWLAREHAPRLLVLESAFTSLRDVAQHLYPWAPTRLLIGNRYPTEALVGEVRAPILVMHSPDDELAPYAHGRRLFERAAPPKRFLPIRGRHNTPLYEGLSSETLDPRTWGQTAGR